MRFRLGFVLASVLAVAAPGCASAGGGAPGSGGVRPRETAETRAAELAINLAIVAGPEQSRPQYEEALSAAQAAITADTTNPLAYKLAGQALIGLDRLGEADEMLDEAEELRPAYVQEETEGIREGAWFYQYERAQPLLDAGDYLGAAEILEGGISIYQQRPEIMVVLGEIYVQEDQPDRAITYLKQADSLIDARAPQVDSSLAADWRAAQADLPVQIAQAYLGAERYDEASAELRSLVAQNPDNILYASNLASVYIRTDQSDLAAGVYENMLRRTDLTPGNLYTIGGGYYNLQSYPEAVDVFERATTASRRDRDALEMWTRSLQLQHGRDSASATPASLQELIGAAERWVELDPNTRTGYVILTQVVNKTGDEDRTVELIDQINALTVGVTDLQLLRNPNGGATVTGDVENLTEPAGTLVNLMFTFYDRQGNAIGTQATEVTLGAPGPGDNQPGARTPIRVAFTADQQVDGYGYQLQQ